MGNRTTFAYDSAGNLTTAKNASGTYTMTYDALDRVATEKEPFGVVLTFSYDVVGNLTVVQDSFGGTTTATFDAVNLLSSRQFSDGTTPLEEEKRDADGTRTIFD